MGSNAASSPPGPEGVFTVHLDALQAAQVRHTAAAWGLTPEQVLTGLVVNQLTACADGVVDLVPPPITLKPM